MERKETVMRINMRRERIAKRVITLVTYAVLLLIIGFLIGENNDLKEELVSTINEYEKIIYEKDKEIDDLNYAINDLGEVIDDIDRQLKEVSAVNKSYVDELNTLRNRSELYDKYEYAIIYNGERTSLTYEEIELGEDLMLSKGYDPDLMFGSIMVESRAEPDVVNTSSGATGYGQFLDSTARWVWTDLLGNDNYYSDIRKDGKVNIQMMASYYDYLYSVNGSTFKVIKSYSGNSTDEGTNNYISKVNSFISTVGAVLN